MSLRLLKGGLKLRWVAELRVMNTERVIGIEAIFSVSIFFYQSYTTP